MFTVFLFIFLLVFLFSYSYESNKLRININFIISNSVNYREKNIIFPVDIFLNIISSRAGLDGKNKFSVVGYLQLKKILEMFTEWKNYGITHCVSC